jgi:hypothetical protein
MMTNELTFPLGGFKHGSRTDISKGILTNKDAALLILAANGGCLPVGTMKTLLRAWRPLEGGPVCVQEGKYDPQTKLYTRPVYSKTEREELHFSYLFNTYYGHISEKYDCGPWPGQPNSRWNMRRYSEGAYMWRPRRHTAAISAYGVARLRQLAQACAKHGRHLEPEITTLVETHA